MVVQKNRRQKTAACSTYRKSKSLFAVLGSAGLGLGRFLGRNLVQTFLQGGALPG
jgi:hypothetical protein